MKGERKRSKGGVRERERERERKRSKGGVREREGKYSERETEIMDLGQKGDKDWLEEKTGRLPNGTISRRLKELVIEKEELSLAIGTHKAAIKRRSLIYSCQQKTIHYCSVQAIFKLNCPQLARVLLFKGEVSTACLWQSPCSFAVISRHVMQKKGEMKQKN